MEFESYKRLGALNSGGRMSDKSNGRMFKFTTSTTLLKESEPRKVWAHKSVGNRTNTPKPLDKSRDGYLTRNS